MNDVQYFLLKIIFIVWSHAKYTLENKSEGYNSYINNSYIMYIYYIYFVKFYVFFINLTYKILV